jgi:hypothetical protein
MGKRGIAVWDGDYYAYELIRALGLAESGGMVRVGFVHYNEPEEIERLAEALREIAGPTAARRLGREGGSMTDKGRPPPQFFEAIRKGNDMAVDAAIGADRSCCALATRTGLSPVLVAAYSGHAKMAEPLAASRRRRPTASASSTRRPRQRRVVRTCCRRPGLGRRPRTGRIHGPPLRGHFGQLEVARLLLGRGADPTP